VARRSAGRQRTVIAERGEIYLVSLDPTQGHEQQGRRPVLVVSPGAFNRLTMVPVVVPVTTGGNFARTRGFAVSLAGAGTRTTGVVRCDQPRALDLDARAGRKLETCRWRLLKRYWLNSRLCSTKGWTAGLRARPARRIDVALEANIP